MDVEMTEVVRTGDARVCVERGNVVLVFDRFNQDPFQVTVTDVEALRSALEHAKVMAQVQNTQETR